MKKLFLLGVFLQMSLIVSAQFITIDSAISRDPFVRLRFDMNPSHGLSKIYLLENGVTIDRYLTPDTSTRDRQSWVYQKAPGTYTYQVMYQKWGAGCGQCFTSTPGLRIQVGPNPCQLPTFLEAGQTGPKMITMTWGLCPACTSYTVTYRRINSTNSAVVPPPDQNVLASADRFSNLVPTTVENQTQIINRSSGTSFDGWWYQVDLRCNGVPGPLNKLTKMVFVAP
jgi:hypothetical protein